MRLTESTRKYILFGFVVFIILGVITAKVMAGQQDEDFVSQNTLYQQATQFYSEGNYGEASKELQQLLKKQPNSEIVNYMAALASASNGEVKQSATLMQKVLAINPHKVEDAMFMLQFGEILTLAERYTDAKVVLIRCKQSAWAPAEYPDYQTRVAQLLTEIENKQ